MFIRYFSEMSSATAVASLITDMKQLFSLITRLLIRYNQVQDLDNFSYYLNSIVSLCYDSANIGYEAFNLNLKAIVLNIVQSIMSDLNSISAIAANGVNNAKFGGMYWIVDFSENFLYFWKYFIVWVKIKNLNLKI